MPVVMKGNKQLTVAEHKIKEFLAIGYSLIDEEGKIVQAGNATSLTEIKSENATLKAELAKYQSINLEEIEAIKAENETLKAQIEDLTSQLEAAAKKGK